MKHVTLHVQRCYLFKYCCWKAKMIKHGRTICGIVHHVIFLMQMAKLTHPWLLSMLAFNVCCANNVKGQLVCDWSYKGWLMGCLMPLLDAILVRKWFCLQCIK